MILDSINSPGDLKKMSIKELEQLADECRGYMIKVISERGGHLASSLGVVELTIALHRVFDAPYDKIVWDVGHQCYAHKILTGRREQFRTIRSYGGISGFPKREESPYDVFGVGHSSTSLSAALGMALARDIRSEKNNVIAIIGDGALTGGMALEALNHGGDIDTNFIVVLNDNEMSIHENVGGLPSYLARLRTDPKYYRLKEDLEQFLARIPAIGKTMVRSAERLKDSLKYLLVPGILFEELGFTYLGPVDGHCISRLQEFFMQAKARNGPVLVHVVTQKGKGYPYAEKEPHRFHGVSPFSMDTGRSFRHEDDSNKCTYSELFGSVLVEMAHKDPSITAITAAMTAGTGLEEFASKLPERFFDVGIAEQHAVTMAAGLAVEGFKPVVAIYSTFLQRAYDQILHDVCLQGLPVVFAVDRAGLVGEDGDTHNGLFDLSYLRNMPGIVLMAPSSGLELACMLKTALQLDSPAAIRYPRDKAEKVPSSQISCIPPGKGRLLREGRDIAILAAGTAVQPALEAHQLLLQRGIKSTVIDPRFIEPLDRDLLCTWMDRCKNVITVEEHLICGGFGSAVLEMLNEEGLKGVRLQRMGLKDPFTGHGKREELLRRHCLTGESIAEEALNLLPVREKVK